ncbi:MAG: Maf family nucleotide pyrophosphatase [Beijerinckiaceae bacterium]
MSAEEAPATLNAFWREPRPLILASKSEARASLLAQTRIPFTAEAADIDERGLEAPLRDNGAGPAAIAAHLARAKARAVAQRRPGRIVLGADQTLALGARMFTKPASCDEAISQLRALSGHTHVLRSALCVMQDGDILFEIIVEAALSMRRLSDSFLTAYADAAGPALLGSVGAYQVEGIGIHLFERIIGDHATILGLPLLPLLAFLRQRGSLLE